MRKTYVLDTNVFLNDSNALYSFENCEVVIPFVVIEELDKIKNRFDEVGRAARQVSRNLDDLRGLGNLCDGVEIQRTKSSLRILAIKKDVVRSLSDEFDVNNADNIIIATAMSEMMNGSDVTLITRDINVRIKCDSLGIKSEDYVKLHQAESLDDLYRGVAVFDNVPIELIDYFYENDKLELPQSISNGKKLFPNQIVVLKNVHEDKTVKSALAKYKNDSCVVPLVKRDHAFGLKPRNKEQIFAFDLLFDDKIKLLTLIGPSGTGKTTLAIAAALEQLKGVGDASEARYEKLIVTRPIQAVGKDLGFLPGTLEEKMDPWISPIKDSLSFLMSGKKSNKRRPVQQDSEKKPKLSDDYYLSMLQEKGIIEIEAIAYMRGRSIPNSFIIIDESQNLTAHELKTIITRAGEGTKIVLTGDIEQIDNHHVDTFTNGLTYAIEQFKEYAIAGHVTLLKGERSELATLASKIL